MYKKFGLNLSIGSQDIEGKLNYDGMTGRKRERMMDMVNPVKIVNPVKMPQNVITETSHVTRKPAF